MSHLPKPIHPHDVGLPPSVIRKRRRARRAARVMLTLGVLTAVAGSLIFGSSIFSALKIEADSPFRVILAYALLIVSTLTLVLGFWYLLRAQVARVARIVEGDESIDPPRGPLCQNCGWLHDPPDRFCRHCGKPLLKSESLNPPPSPSLIPPPA